MSSISILFLKRRCRKLSEEVILNKSLFEGYTNQQLISIYESSHSLATDAETVMFFSVLREVASRLSEIKLVANKEQLYGAILATKGIVLDMKTGEGKTLVASFVAIAKCKDYDRVRVATSNDYLANRDAKLMKPIFDFFNLSLSFPEEENYTAKIQYDTLTNFCLHWLRDHVTVDIRNFSHFDFDLEGMKSALIVDEIDYTLIDVSTNPFAVTDKVTPPIDYLNFAFNFATKVLSKHPDIAWKEQESVHFSMNFYDLLSSVFGSGFDEFVSSNPDVIYKVRTAIKAISFMSSGVEYLVKNSEVYRLCPRTGRASKGQIESDLLAFLEIKEGLPVSPWMDYLVISTIPNYVKRYDFLTGMSGSASTNKLELEYVYGLKVVQISPHREVKRVDKGYYLYSTTNLVYEAALKLIKSNFEQKLPTLISCKSDVESECFYDYLIKQQCLFGDRISLINSKNIEFEAEVFSKAGEAGRVTVSTRICGRGLDVIVPSSINEFGGLQLISMGAGETEVDDLQFAGRTGRQGANGSVIYLLSADDPAVVSIPNITLNRLLCDDKNGCDDSVQKNTKKIVGIYQKAKQKSLRARRKHLMLFDRPMAKQLDIFREMRRRILQTSSVSDDSYRNVLTEADLELLPVFLNSVQCERVLEIYKGCLLASLDMCWRRHCSSISNAREENMMFGGTNLIKYQEIAQGLMSNFISDYQATRKMVLGNAIRKEVQLAKFLNEPI